MEIRKNSLWLRRAVLIVVVLHITYVNLAYVIFGQNTIQQVTEKYKSLFVPASYTFSIWGLIYLALIVYSIYQLLPSQRDKKIFDDIALPLMISMTCGIWWAITYNFELIGLSMIFIIAMLVFSFMIFKTVYLSILFDGTSKILLIPFSILFAWLTSAAIANFTVWLVSIGRNGSFFSEIALTRLLVFATAIIAITISVKYWNYIYPLTLVWTLIGIYIGRKDDLSSIGTPAFICALVLLVWSVIVVFLKKTPQLRDIPR